MHVGMIDHVGMEVGDIAQISALGFPKADPEAPLVKLGSQVSTEPNQSSCVSATT